MTVDETATATVLKAAVTRDGTLLAITLSAPPTAINGNIFVFCGLNTYPIPPSQVIWSRTISHVVLKLPIKIVPSDQVDVGIPSLTIAIQGGYVAATSFAVANRAGTDLDPFDSSKITMPLGTNAPGTSDFEIVPIFNNKGKHLSGWAPDAGVTQAVDEHGNLTSVEGGRTVAFFSTAMNNEMAGQPLGYDSLPAGEWTMLHDEIVDGKTETITTKTNYQQKAGEAYFPIFLTTTNKPISNVRLYAPGADQTQQFCAYALDKMKHFSCVRWMDAWGTNGCGVVTMGDIHSPQDATYSYGKSAPITGTVISIEPYDNAQHCFQVGGDWVHAVCKTSEPHGLIDGRVVTFGPSLPRLALASGASVNPSGVSCSVNVLDDTTFAVSFWCGAADQSFVPATASLPWQTHCPPTIPLEDIVAWHNLTKQDVWLNIPPLFTDAACVQAFTYLRDHLDPTLKVHVEWGNEPWNFGTAFYTYWHCRTQAGKSGLTLPVWYVFHAAGIHATAAPLLGDRLIRTFGSWYANPLWTQQIVTYASSQKIQIDEIAVATYLSNMPDDPTMGPLCDTLTIEQQMDLFEVSIWSGEQTKYLAQHLAILKADYPDAKLVCYEGGPDSNNLGTTTADRAKRTRAWAVDPLMGNCYRAFAMKAQDIGVALLNDYTLSHPNGAKAWSKWLGWNQMWGQGLPIGPGHHDNRADPYSAKVQAVIPYNQRTWQSQRAQNLAAKK